MTCFGGAFPDVRIALDPWIPYLRHLMENPFKKTHQLLDKGTRSPKMVSDRQVLGLTTPLYKEVFVLFM